MLVDAINVGWPRRWSGIESNFGSVSSDNQRQEEGETKTKVYNQKKIGTKRGLEL